MCAESGDIFKSNLMTNLFLTTNCLRIVFPPWGKNRHAHRTNSHDLGSRDRGYQIVVAPVINLVFFCRPNYTKSSDSGRLLSWKKRKIERQQAGSILSPLYALPRYYIVIIFGYLV